MLELKTPREIDAMRTTGAFIAGLLDDLAQRAAPGVNLLDLEHRARDLIAERGAVSCYWDYAPSFGSGPFRNVICLSVNDAVLHGLPHDYVLQDGDVLSMDIAVSIDGWVADSARTVVVGTERPEDHRLIESTERALAAGIAAAQPGNRLGDISAAIGAVAAEYGYPVNTQFGGHGLGLLGPLERERLVAPILAVIAIGLYVLCFLGTKEVIPASAEKPRLATTFRMVAKNKPLLVLCFGAFAAGAPTLARRIGLERAGAVPFALGPGEHPVEAGLDLAARDVLALAAGER